MKPILLFDIDGTLLHIKRKFLNSVIDQILDELKISREVLNGMSFAGRTDKDIFNDLVYTEGGNSELFYRVKGMYIEKMLKSLTGNYIDLIHGAAQAVEYAVAKNYDVGLCTGNFREVAFAKVDAAGFNNVFRFGGFGCDHKDRIYLPGAASLEHQRITRKTAEPHQYIVIGDTPNDIRCAKYFGAVSVAVTTGGFTRKELEKYEPDLLLDHLGDTGSWIEKLY